MSRYLDAVQSHLKKLSTQGRANYCDQPTSMWMASLNTRTREYPTSMTRPRDIGSRTLSYIDAPHGCTMYWDQPQLVAAHHLSGIIGDKRYARSADAYVKDFLKKCVSREGVFLWGNHYYYDAFADCVQFFTGEQAPRPYDMEKDHPIYHETRPIPPAWDLFWRVDEKVTRRHIERVANMHVYDVENGAFSVHSSGQREVAFLEFGGILAETMLWLGGKLGRVDMQDMGLRVAEYSAQFADPGTGLIPVNPGVDRWDQFTSTTEVGLWAGCLLRGAAAIGDNWMSDRLLDLAAMGMHAYMEHGWDKALDKLYGRLDIRDGAASDDQPTHMMPGIYSDLWEPYFPTHNYPMQFTEACLLLTRAEGGHEFYGISQQLAEMIANQVPQREEIGGYAEFYGRQIHVLLRASELLGDENLVEVATALADQAMEHLYAHGMFRGHTGEDRYDAVDGVGYLLLALLHLETGQDPPMMGCGW